VLTMASALSRLRYWLHLVQAPNYGPGFIAAERRSPSVRAGFSCSVQVVARRPPSVSPPLFRPRCESVGAGGFLLSALEILHRVDDRTTLRAHGAPRTMVVRMGMALWSVVRQHYEHHPSFSRLRYWLHPSQAPKYGRGFIASEELVSFSGTKIRRSGGGAL